MVEHPNCASGLVRSRGLPTLESIFAPAFPCLTGLLRAPLWEHLAIVLLVSQRWLDVVVVSHRGPPVNRARGSGDPPMAVKSGLAIGHAPVPGWLKNDALPPSESHGQQIDHELRTLSGASQWWRWSRQGMAAWMSISCGYVGDAVAGSHALSCSILLTMPSRTMVGVVSYCTATMTGALG